MNVPGRRQQRLGDLIRVEISSMIARELKDPRIGFTTVIEVKVTPDLHEARVYVSVLGNAEQQAESLRGLTAAASFVRHELAHRLRLRRAPVISFHLDHSVEQGARIEELIAKLKQES